MNRRNPHPLKNCLDNFKKSWGDLDKLSKLNENWKNFFGLELFQECKPLNIEKKVLTIAVNHPQWRQALIYNKHKLKERICLLYTSPSPRDRTRSRMPSSA